MRSMQLLVILFFSSLLLLNACQPTESGPPPVTEPFVSTLRNLDFEAAGNGFPVAWEYAENVSGKGEVLLDATVKQSGQSALKLSPNAKNDNAAPLAIRQLVNVNALRGKKVTISGHIRNRGATGMLALLTLENGVPKNMKMLTGGGDQWQSVSTEYPIPSRGDVRLVIICMVNGQSGSTWFDQIRMDVPGQNQAGQRPAPQQPEITEAEAKDLKASVKIHLNQVIRTVPRELFGTNVEWRWHGNHLWQARQDRLDPAMVNLTREMGVSLIRYPGGLYSDFFHWRDAIGDRKERKMVQHEVGLADQSVPYLGPDEAYDFARRVNGELMITVNVGTGTPEEAADWVRYMNRDSLKVRYWEVGNELYYRDGSKHTEKVGTTADDYARRYLEFAKAMRAADSRIQLGAIGGLNHQRYAVMHEPDWNEKVLGKIAGHYDFLAVHNGYAPVMATQKEFEPEDVYRAMFAYPRHFQQNLKDLLAQIDRHNAGRDTRGREVTLAVTEWGPFFHVDFNNAYIDHGKTLGSSIYVASALKTMLESPRTKIANFWLLNDLSVLGWIATSDDSFPPRPKWTKTARYKVFQLFTKYLQKDIIQTEVQSPTFHSKDVGFMTAASNVPWLDVVASKGDGQLSIFVINKHFDKSMEVDLALPGLNGKITLKEAKCLNGTGLDAHTGTKIIKVPGMKVARQKQSRHKRLHQGGKNEIKVVDFKPKTLKPLNLQVPPLSVSMIMLEVEGN